MLRLLESGMRPAPRAGWTFASSFAHGSIIAMAVFATMQTQRRVASPDPELDVWYVAPRPAVANPVGAGTAGDAPPGAPRLSLPSITLPRLAGIDLDITPRLGALTTAPGTWNPGGVAGATGLPGDGAGLAPTAVHEESQVDRAVMAARDNPRPDYPQSLRGVGLTGDVIVRFVVDTSGRVERGSVEVLSATHQLFGDAVRNWLPRTRYVPAEFHGRRVRQLVQQRVTFELTR